MIKQFILSVFLLARFLPCDAQSADGFFNFDHIPAAGDTLLSHWKFHPGDDIACASNAYDDKDWKAIDPNIYITDFVKTHPEHVGWFRVKINVSSALRNKIVGISCNAVGATEMYLNGKLIRKLGNVDNDPSKVKVVFNVFKPIPVLLSNDSVQVLSVKFAYKPNTIYVVGSLRKSLLTAGIGDPQLEYGLVFGFGTGSLLYMCMFFAGLNFAFCLLHAFMYFYYKRGLYNFYYSLFTLFGAFLWTIPLLLVYVHRLEMTNMLLGIDNLLLLLDPVCLALTVYSFLGYTKRTIFIILFSLGLSTLSLQFYQSNFSFAVINLPSILFFIHLWRVAYLARKSAKPGSSFILFGISSYIIFIGFASLLTALTNNIVVFALLNGVGTACNFIALSLAIAKRLADTNILLGHKLEEVKSLAIEKESILTGQNVLLEEKVEERTTALQHSLQQLKATQSQLIHSEKMASLGELTAGIAHEIQNPLNFVNNFSDLNKELIVELKEEIEAGNVEDVKAIANDIQTNEEKISHHGKRAQSIVTGMLQHSRTGKGEKQLTDINKLADEYLRLSYHGIRAKDKDLPAGQAGFNCDIETSFDETIGQINIIPQEIGRVILNLVNNAFYAVNERLRQAQPDNRSSEPVEDYKPTVTVTTRKENDHILISVADNGNGIPDKIKEKIFNPFFTTKPTGQGTGLGLSLSYDIVKAHGGEIKVQSKEGEGTEFVIMLLT